VTSTVTFTWTLSIRYSGQLSVKIETGFVLYADILADMSSRALMNLQPWNPALTLEPHSCDVCNTIILDPNFAETEEVGRRTHKYTICDLEEQVFLTTQGQPAKCGLIRHHIEHRGPALEAAVRRRTERQDSDLKLEIHSFDGNGLDISTAYTMVWGQRLTEFNVYAIESTCPLFLNHRGLLLILYLRRSCRTLRTQTAEKSQRCIREKF
jgi:hypothetical protein